MISGLSQGVKTMVIALTQPSKKSNNSFVTLDEDNLQLDVNFSVTIGITAEQAKRKLTHFLMDEVSLLISPQAPLLVIADKNAIFWRFPIIFSMGHRGKLGQVGEIDVDACNGELLITHDLVEEIKTHAYILAKSTTLSTNN
jgi:hypothetical protein